ncbi:ISL3 family transposase ISArch13 [bioreactor metagenome]|uniref:ISL3 family transposase ISArch13 n=1 Tax=bioreactor metagenome TaxID=1076179 RepID=A0A645A3W3_9ZZZZ
MPVNLYYTQKIRGFQQQSVKYTATSVKFSLKRTKFQCPRCGFANVTLEPIGHRCVHGEPMGCCHEVIFEFMTHRLYCPRCKARKIEHIPFLSHPWSRMTKSLERTVLELRHHMSIQAVTDYLHLRWHTIKELEKKHLKKKFSRIQTAHIKAIGIDEIHVGRGMQNQQFLTIVRDLESGTVIHVGDGKGVSALAGALKKLKKSKLKIVTMDMANSYYTWISENFPKAHIVFDHFHVIKLMNDKLDLVRRRVTAKMDDLQKKQLKGLRFIFLKNKEDLPEDAKSILRNMRGDFQELGDAYMFKEALRTIYMRAKTSYHAKIAFHRWSKLAEETGVPELKTMARTVRDKLDGIVSFWTFHHISNAKMEGFNNKIRWLIRQAYGFRDREYFKLKIYQLPEISCVKQI